MDNFNQLTEEQIKAAFDAADKDQSGKLELAEIKEVFATLGIEKNENDIKANLPEGGLDFDGLKALVASAKTKGN